MINLEKNELAKVGVQFGSLTRRWSPHMRPYIYGRSNKSKTHILDLQKIVASCQEVGNYLNSLIKERKKILFLCTKKQIREIVKEQAIKCGMPYIVNKWKGGFLTNFREIGKKLKELQGLNSFVQKDNFKNLIKKEQVIIEKRRAKLQSIYEGVIGLTRPPEALFIIGLNKEKTAFKEAKKKGVSVLAVCNSNCNPQLVDYVIPGNDENVESIKFFASLVADAIQEIKQQENLTKIDKEKAEKY
jgi:small subunit ribosomal protein S2